MAAVLTLQSTLEAMRFPSTFPVAAYDAVGDYMRKHAHTRAWKAWVMGWKGVAYRFRAMVEEHESFCRGLLPPEDGEKRFAQERSFYGLLTNGFSTLSCCSYAVHAMASAAAPTDFPILTASALRLYPEDIARKLVSHPSPFQTEPITIKINACVGSPEYSEMRDMRNALDHRGMVGRLISPGDSDLIPSNLLALPDQWIVDLPLDARTAQRLLDFVSGQLADLVGAAAAFGLKYL